MFYHVNMSLFEGLIVGGVVFLVVAAAVFIIIFIRSKQAEITDKITLSHRAVWSFYVDNIEKLKRVFVKNIDLEKEPITDIEKRFSNMLFIHMETAFEISRKVFQYTSKESKKDYANFFSRSPLMANLWENSKQFRNPKFLKIVQKARENI